jgi:hypothetical protein
LSVVSELSTSWFKTWTEAEGVGLSSAIDAHGTATYEVLLGANILLLNIHHVAWKFGHVKSTNILFLNGISSSHSTILW